MRQILGRFSLVGILTLTASAQTPAVTEFDAAEIKLNRSGAQEMREQILPGGEVLARNVPLLEMLKLAWNVRDGAVDKLPPWAGSDRYDVSAKMPAGTPEETVRLMMRNLLARDFKISVHQEQRPTDVYVMTVAKGGVKMTPSVGEGRQDCKRSVTPEFAAEAACTHLTTAGLAQTLERFAPAYVDRQVIDETGLEGPWDVTLRWVGLQAVDNGGLTMFDALEKQAGLRLQSQKRPMPAIVIDHIERLAEASAVPKP